MNLNNPKYIPCDLLALFRVVFGLCMAGAIVRYLIKGHAEAIYVVPVLDNYFPWAPWFSPLPGVWMMPFFSGLGVLAFFIGIGFFSRPASILFCVGYAYSFLSQSFHYLNHGYLIILISFLLVLTPCHRKWALDCWLLKKPEIDCVDITFFYAMRFLIGIPYFFGGIAKLNSDWLSGQPMGLWLAKRQDWPLIGQFFDERWAALFYSWGGAIFDLLIVPALLWNKSRTIAIVFAVLFHLSNMMMFTIGVFPWLMAGALILFADPHFFRRPPANIHQINKYAVMSMGIKFTLIVFFILQVCLPFRHFFFHGNPSWTEEAHQFAWHMMLRDKKSYGIVAIVNREERVIGIINPREIMPKKQYSKSFHFPELSRQMAAYIRKDLEGQGLKNFEVRVLSLSSLNGRKYQLLVDPSVDLSRVEYEPFKSADWIVPLYEPFDRGEVDWSKVPERYKKFKIPEYSRETGQIPYREFYIHLMHEMGWEDQLLPEKGEGDSGENGAEAAP